MECVFEVSTHSSFSPISQVHVFQAFPFLGSAHEAFTSCREFVCHQLQELQASTPQVLDNICEARLDVDIGNDNVRVVRGDGVETSSGRYDMEVQMNENPSDDQDLPSWTSLSQVASNASDTNAGSNVASSMVASMESHPSLRRIKSALSVITADIPLTKMTEGGFTGGRPASDHSVTRPTSPKIRKTSSHTGIGSFVEQWTLSSKNCSIRQAQVAT